ncbi:MAG: mannose-1-phosphate guanylyltransferase/mannose-6-phosphate isomerase [Halocynthiibacter sp.]
MITPILLCGGTGTRLWPLSRASYPKQFSRIFEEQSLFQSAAKRVHGHGFGAPIVVTGSDFRFIATQQLNEVCIDPNAVLIEPAIRDTAPAILAAALYLEAQDPDQVMLVTPTDHFIPDGGAFQKTVQQGEALAKAGSIVTFGIVPTAPETGYGYLELGDAALSPAFKVKAFCEKPDQERAKEMIAKGGYLWNSGLFMATAATIVAAFSTHDPVTLASVRMALAHAHHDLGFLRLSVEAWDPIVANSIDFAIMEKATNTVVIPFEGHWSDLGGWEAIRAESDCDEKGVATTAGVSTYECRDSIFRSEDPDMHLVGIGLADVVAVATKDAVMVAHRDKLNEMKPVLADLKDRGILQATHSKRDHRPWGWFETLSEGDRFQVKRIVVYPNGALSLQSHVHRAEHWVVVAGTATVTIDDRKQLIPENQSVYIPLGAKHRLENTGKVDLHLIEVQTGGYLGEDDIVRYEDIYARDPEKDVNPA